MKKLSVNNFLTLQLGVKLVLKEGDVRATPTKLSNLNLYLFLYTRNSHSDSNPSTFLGTPTELSYIFLHLIFLFIY